MIHPTYRSLDAPVKLLGLAWRQWISTLAGGGGLIALVSWLDIPTRPAISFCAIAIGVPLALAYLSEETGFGFGQLVADMARWGLASRRFHAGPSRESRSYVVVERAGKSESAEAPDGADW